MPAAPLPSAIGKYRVLRELGRGATSTVYLADDPFNGRQVALKRIHPHLLADERQGRRLRLRRSLRNEAQLAGRMRHPHIVGVWDADCEADPPYVVLEYIEGAALSRFTSPDRLLPAEQVLDICYKCCSALEYAHDLGLVHRDVKPANLILQSDGLVKLTDFGTAISRTSDDTVVSGLHGSPTYMSPEQVRDEPCTHRSDMFSLAVVAYELLTGRQPFAGPNDYVTLYRISTQQPTPPSVLRPDLPTAVDDALMLALAKDPRHRYAEWIDFGEALLAVRRTLGGHLSQHSDGERFARMRALPFFRNFHDPVLWEALRLGTFRTVRGGSLLMREGEVGESFSVLLHGRASVLHRGRKVTTLEHGVTLGEMAYLRAANPIRTATVVAQEEATVLDIRNEALRRASDDLQSCFDKAFIDLLLDRLVATTDLLGTP